MIKKLRRRIILINMLLMGVVILGLFTAVNINNYITSTRNFEHGLDRLLNDKGAGGFQPPDSREQDEPRKLDKRGFDGETPMQITSYVLVTLDQNGNLISKQENNVTIDDGDLVECIKKADGYGGQISEYGLMYARREIMGETRIAFAPNNSVFSDLKSSLLVSGLLFLGGMTVIFLISLFLSGLAVKPVKKAWEQQKQFVADASHELKTPLTVILANNNIMLSHPDALVREEKQWLDSTAEEAGHMKKLIDNMLFLAKSDAGANEITLSEVNLSEILEGCVLSFEPVAFEKDVMINAEITPGITIQGDPTLLKQLAHILTDNAVKYAEEGTAVTVGLQRRGDHAEFTVNNRGNVISEEDLEHIFDRFYRAEKSRTTKGYGLGLSIAQRITESMNGKISVVSNESQGTTFTVRL